MGLELELEKEWRLVFHIQEEDSPQDMGFKIGQQDTIDLHYAAFGILDTDHGTSAFTLTYYLLDFGVDTTYLSKCITRVRMDGPP